MAFASWIKATAFQLMYKTLQVQKAELLLPNQTYSFTIKYNIQTLCSDTKMIVFWEYREKGIFDAACL